MMMMMNTSRKTVHNNVLSQERINFTGKFSSASINICHYLRPSKGLIDNATFNHSLHAVAGARSSVFTYSHAKLRPACRTAHDRWAENGWRCDQPTTILGTTLPTPSIVLLTVSVLLAYNCQGYWLRRRVERHSK